MSQTGTTNQTVEKIEDPGDLEQHKSHSSVNLTRVDSLNLMLSLSQGPSNTPPADGGPPPTDSAAEPNDSTQAADANATSAAELGDAQDMARETSKHEIQEDIKNDAKEEDIAKDIIEIVQKSDENTKKEKEQSQSPTKADSADPSNREATTEIVEYKHEQQQSLRVFDADSMRSLDGLAFSNTERDKAIEEMTGKTIEKLRSPKMLHKRQSSSGWIPIANDNRYFHKVETRPKKLKKHYKDSNKAPKPEDIDEEELKELEMYHYQPKKEKKRIVFFDGKLKRLSEISTANETFNVVFHFYLTWLATEDEVQEFYYCQNNRKLKFQPKWNPQLKIDNKVDGKIHQISAFSCKEGYSYKNRNDSPLQHGWGDCKTSWDIPRDAIGFDPRRAYWLRVQYDCEVVCAEELELEFFPFDCQDFGIYLRSKDKADKVDILPMPRVGNFFNIDAKYSMVSEWLIPGLIIEFHHGNVAASKVGLPYPEVTIRIKAERKWVTHMSNLIITCCMFLLGLASFSIHQTDIGERLGYCVTLLLADVATMQLVFHTMPNIPYNTFMDTYMYTCFGFLVCITFWTAVAGFGGRNTVPEVGDRIALGVFAIIGLIIHFQVTRHVIENRYIERSKLTMGGQELDKYFEELERQEGSEMPVSGCDWNPDKLLSQNFTMVQITEPWIEREQDYF